MFSYVCVANRAPIGCDASAAQNGKRIAAAELLADARGVSLVFAMAVSFHPDNPVEQVQLRLASGLDGELQAVLFFERSRWPMCLTDSRFVPASRPLYSHCR